MSLSARQSLLSDYALSHSVDWEEIDCPLCGSDQYSPYIEASDAAQEEGLRFLVVQCQRCLLRFTNPRPSPLCIGQFYADNYEPHMRREKRLWGNGSRWRRFFSAQPERKLRNDLRPHGEGRLLDFGCGGGSFLMRMRARGWNVTGLDFSLSAMESLRIDGIPALHGSLPHAEILPQSFDMITMWHSLEHVHQPLEVLRAAHAALAPAGKILVAVPNIESLPFRWFGPDWFGLDLPRHLTHFTPATLKAMLEYAGFRTGRVCLTRGSAWIRQSAKLAGRAAAKTSRWMSSRIGSNLASWYAYLRGMADRMMIMGLRV